LFENKIIIKKNKEKELREKHLFLFFCKKKNFKKKSE